jgi:RimJ/RimL family protein N-acetyltransferase
MDPADGTPRALRTARLELIPGDLASVQAEFEGRDALARAIDARVPKAWPPELYDRPAMEWIVRYFEANPSDAGWVNWYMVLREPGQTGGRDRTLIGLSGFKGRPTPDGIAEIGYGTLPDYRCMGLATESAGLLIGWAFEHAEVQRVVAETYPELVASIRVMEKNGLELVGPGSEERVIRYGITRERYDARRTRASARP